MDFSDYTNKKYIKKNVVSILELNLKIYELEHIKTKSKILLYESHDDNKVFNICFKTPASNNKGIAHILEHSVLCGSKKYDVKEPFVELAKSSLNTFLNAMTFSDKTCYPVASCNFKDFCNLMDVYLDAVFFPNIYKNEYIFMQEGWRYELINKNNDLSINGVVYNEMKGVFSDPQSILEHDIFESLYSGTNYMFESGGIPKDIINLSYEEFINFHKKYYSPTNAIISLYGDLDFNERLKYIDENYLSKFEYDEKKFILFDENFTFDKNNDFYSIKYFDSKEKNNNILSFNYVLDYEKDNLKHIVMLILNYILFTQVGAIVKDELLKQHICQSVDSMYEPSLKNGFFSIILHNVNIENSSDKNRILYIKNLIYQILKNITENGIDKNKIKAGINAIHFSFIDDDTSYPKGLNYILTTLESYLYNNNNIDIFLKYKNTFEFLNNLEIDNINSIFSDTINEVFLNNSKTSISLVYPKSDLLKIAQENENQYLYDIKNNLNKKGIDNLIYKQKYFKEYQNSIDDLNCLPVIDLKDINREKNIININEQNIDNTKIITTNNENDELIYFNFNIKLDNFSNEEKYYLGILIKLFTKVSTKNFNYEDLNNLIDTYTGYFSTTVKVVGDNAYLRFTFKTLKNNFEKSMSILKEVLFNTKFDDYNRIKNILFELKIESNLSILNSGHTAALTRAMANMSLTRNFSNYISANGISFNMFLNELVSKYDEVKEKLISNLIIIYNKILNNKNIFFDYSSNLINQKECNIQIKNFILEFSEKQVNNDNKNIVKIMNIDSFDRKHNKEGFLINSDINFVARAGRFDKNKFSGVLQLIKTILTYDYLWTNIRVIGGAYGMGVVVDREGFIGFTTYRDPNLKKSDIVFKNIIDYLKDLEIDDKLLLKYKIGTIGSIDTPLNQVLFHETNINYYLLNISNEILNKNRCEIIDSNLSDIKNNILIFDDVINTCEVCSLISKKCEREGKNYYKNIKDLFYNE